MNKKIKIITLINKIANGEEMPIKVKYQGTIYKFYKEEKDYISYDETEWYGQTLLFNVMVSHHITELLDAEVEILEDNTEEIEELKKSPEQIFNPETGLKELIYKYQVTTEDICNKINELVKAVNQMRKDINKEYCCCCGVEITDENRTLHNMCNECKYGMEREEKQ